MDDIKVILFDMGGVIFELFGAAKLLEWMDRDDIGIDDVNHMWSKSDAVAVHESGRCSPEEFAKAIIKEMKLKVTTEEFLKEFVYFPRCFYKGAEELLISVSRKYITASFSNTNEIQWNRLNQEFKIEKYFKKNYLSYRIGLMKPDKEFYEYIIKDIGYKPSQIMFFDDNEANVDMGNKVGIKSYRVFGTEGLRDKLKELNLL